MTRSPRRDGFTLIEILIVVVILGILAALVVPQFTNASEDVRTSAVRGQLRTVRSQIELFNVDRPDPVFGDYDGGTPLGNAFWDGLVDNDYLQQMPRNALQDAATATVVAAVPAADAGWVWDGSDIVATDGAGGLFTE